MKRFSIKTLPDDSYLLYESKNGVLVNYKDAHAIELERDALRAELDRLKAEIHESHHDRGEK